MPERPRRGVDCGILSRGPRRSRRLTRFFAFGKQDKAMQSIVLPLRLIAVLIALSLSAGQAFATPEEDVDRIEDARYDAMIRGDLTGLAATLADEFLYYQPSGKTATKSIYIEQLASGAVKIYKAQRYDVQIHVYGEIATVMGSTRLDISFSGDRREVDLRYLNVWVLRDGRWQLAARQSAFKSK
jgi:ketosteroid isomerase-like protein